jgi:hypothetical protein
MPSESLNFFQQGSKMGKVISVGLILHGVLSPLYHLENSNALVAKDPPQILAQSRNAPHPQQLC